MWKYSCHINLLVSVYASVCLGNVDYVQFTQFDFDALESSFLPAEKLSHPIDEYSSDLWTFDPSAPEFKTASRSSLKWLQLRYVSFDPTVLVPYLEACRNLEGLVLNRAFWPLDSPFKARLSKLKVFSLTRHEPEYNNILDFRKLPDIMSLFPFYKESTSWETDIQHWEGMRVRINAHYFNAATLELDFKSGTAITEVFPSQNLSNVVGIDKFSFKSCQLDPSHLPREVKALSIQPHVDIIGADADVSTLLRRFPHLEYLELNIDESTTAIDIGSMPSTTLKSVKVQNLDLLSSSSGLPVRFATLETVTMYNCDLDLSLIYFQKPLTSLDLTSMKPFRGSLTSSLEGATSLQKLNIDMLNGDKDGNHYSPTTIELCGLQYSTLRELSLDTLTVSLGEVCEFKLLKKLKMASTKLPALLIENFILIFPGLEDLNMRNQESIVAVAIEELPSLRRLEFRLATNPDFSPEPAEVLKGLELYLRQFEYFGDRFDGIKAFNGTMTVRLEKGGDGAWGYDPDYTARRKAEEDEAWREELKLNVIRAVFIAALIVCLFGLVGNGLSALVLWGGSMRNQGSTRILLGLTFCDTVVLASYTLLVLNAIGMTMETEPWIRETLDALEYFVKYIVYPVNKTAYTGSVYLTVLLNAERYVAVCYPFRSMRYLSARKSGFWTLGVLLFAILLNLSRWFEAVQFDTVDAEYEDEEYTLDEVAAYRTYYHGWTWIILMYALPITVMATLNVGIWKQIRRSNRNRRTMSGSGTEHEAVDVSITRMLICLVHVFLLCNLIHIILFAVLFWYFYMVSSTIEYVSCFPLIVNSAVNFIIYCAMGAKFRKELRQLFPACCRWQRTPAQKSVSSRSGRPTEVSSM